MELLRNHTVSPVHAHGMSKTRFVNRKVTHYLENISRIVVRYAKTFPAG